MDQKPCSSRPGEPYRVIVGLLLLVCGVLMVSACATVPVGVDSDASARWEQRSQQVERATSWRLVARAEIDAGGGYYPVLLQWRSDAELDVVDLSGPGGQGGGRLTLRPDTTTLQMRSGERFVNSDPDVLARELLGVSVPVRATRDWVRAIARTADDARSFDAQGRLESLRRDGWEIRYAAYAVSENAPDVGAMPAEILLIHRGHAVRIRLYQARWFLEFPAATEVGETHSPAAVERLVRGRQPANTPPANTLITVEAETPPGLPALPTAAPPRAHSIP